VAGLPVSATSAPLPANIPHQLSVSQRFRQDFAKHIVTMQSVEEVIVKSARMESPLEEQEQDILSLKIGFCALSIVSCKAGYAFG